MDESHSEEQIAKKEEGLLLPASIIVAAAMIAGAWIYTSGLEYRENQVKPEERALALEETVLPAKGVVLPVAWKDLGVQMVRSGVIDKEKFEKLYENRGGLGQDEKKLKKIAKQATKHTNLWIKILQKDEKMQKIMIKEGII